MDNVRQACGGLPANRHLGRPRMQNAACLAGLVASQAGLPFTVYPLQPPLLSTAPPHAPACMMLPDCYPTFSPTRPVWAGIGDSSTILVAWRREGRKKGRRAGGKARAGTPLPSAPSYLNSAPPSPAAAYWSGGTGDIPRYRTLQPACLLAACLPRLRGSHKDSYLYLSSFCIVVLYHPSLRHITRACWDASTYTYLLLTLLPLLNTCLLPTLLAPATAPSAT